MRLRTSASTTGPAANAADRTRVPPTSRTSLRPSSVPGHAAAASTQDALTESQNNEVTVVPHAPQSDSAERPGTPLSCSGSRRRRGVRGVRRRRDFSWRPFAYGFGGTVFSGIAVMCLFLFGDRLGLQLPHHQGRMPDAAAGHSGAGSARTESERTAELSADDGRPHASVPITQAGQATLTSLTAADDTAPRENADQEFLKQTLVPFLTKHCQDCHGPYEQMAGIAVHKLDSTDAFFSSRRTWERVYRMVKAGAMPPQDYEPQPDENARTEVADFLHGQLFDFDCNLVDHPGRPTIQRLNRAEYNNTIQDLFGIELTPADAFPADDVGEGFDNIGDVLTLPPLLMEKYLEAAEDVALAVIDTHDYSQPTTVRLSADQLKASRGGRVGSEGLLVLSTNGTASADVHVPAAGRYRLRTEAAADQAGDEKARMALQVDGETVEEFTIDKHRKPEWYEQEVTLTAGQHRLAAAFLNDYYNPEAKGSRKDRNLGVRAIELIGPAGGTSDPPWPDVHRRFVTQRPDAETSVRDAAAVVLQPIMNRAFRRPVSDDEVGRYAALVEQQVNEADRTYEQALAIALQAVLVAPDFLFRLEPDPEGNADRRPLNDYEVASRLSYFLWSSMPDEELFALAEQQQLRDPETLRKQIARMLQDDRAEALAENFASQWLSLRNLAEVTPDPDTFPEFDDALRSAMAEETRLLFNTIVREDRSIDEFLTANFTFVNERLAEHYGLPGVSGDAFVRVALEGTHRAGVLTHGSVLTLTSNPARTSPVKRGKWILKNILNDAPPPAPPSVPPFEETAEARPDLSLREQLALHREDPGCASCHKTMDPLGLGLENFDAIGRWREQDGKHAVDASGTLPGGESFTGPQELIAVIRSQGDRFHRALTERMLTYALGRGLDYYDKCAVDQTLERLAERGNRFSALVEGIVLSDCFLYRSREREARLAAQ